MAKKQVQSVENIDLDSLEIVEGEEQIEVSGREEKIQEAIEEIQGELEELQDIKEEAEEIVDSVEENLEELEQLVEEEIEDTQEKIEELEEEVQELEELDEAIDEIQEHFDDSEETPEETPEETSKAQIGEIVEITKGSCRSGVDSKEAAAKLKERELELAIKTVEVEPSEVPLWKLKRGQKFRVINGKGGLSQNVYEFLQTDGMYARVVDTSDPAKIDKYINVAAKIKLVD